MNITNYFNHEGELISFSQHQASSFAKGVAGDFNPIHDEGAKRFCVPGDLLFAVCLSQYGIHQEMKFEFAGMVVDKTRLIFPKDVYPKDRSKLKEQSSTFSLQGDNDKNYLDIVISGQLTHDSAFISELSEKYVQFSGKTFPHILVPLMEKEGVMINPARPLVIYKNMEIHLKTLSGENIELELKDSLLQKNGKKGEVRLEFNILANGDIIGSGAKNLILSGLREYDQAQLNEIINTYDQRKSDFIASQ